MNREVHVRFWERAEVKFLRATRHSRRLDNRHESACAFLPDVSGTLFIRRDVPKGDIMETLPNRAPASGKPFFDERLCDGGHFLHSSEVGLETLRQLNPVNGRPPQRPEKIRVGDRHSITQ